MVGASPAPPRRDEALAFIIDRIVRSGISPSFREISRALRVSDTRAKELVAQLIELGYVEKTPGAQRNLRVRDVARSRGLVEQSLRRMGWTTSDPLGPLRQPFPDRQLPMLPDFEHLPELD